MLEGNNNIPILYYFFSIGCSDTEFVCDEKCLPIEKYCDGVQGCDSNSDELDCPLPVGKCCYSISSGI